jgi:predicted transcriptional regulator
VFRPAVTRDDFLRRRLTDLADQVCEGTASPLILALVEGGRFTADDIDQFRRLLDRLEHSPPPPRKRG